MSYRTRNSSVFLLILVMLCAVVLPAAAQVKEMEDIANKVLGLFTSDLVKIVLTIALGGLGLGLILNKDNETMKKRFIVWLVAVGILRAMSGIVEFFFDK